MVERFADLQIRREVFEAVGHVLIDTSALTTMIIIIVPMKRQRTGISRT